MVPLDELEEYSRGSRRRRYLVLGLVVVAAASLLFFVLQPVDEDEEPARLPAFELPLLEGKGTLSSDDLRGKPAVLNFFASWCLPCREEAPLFERTYKEYKQEGVQFVGVATTDTEERARAFVEEFGITYPVVADLDHTLFDDLDLIGLPQTIFVSPDLEVATTGRGDRLEDNEGLPPTLGAISSEELHAQIEVLLEDG